jgi:hypothetical protein
MLGISRCGWYNFFNSFAVNCGLVTEVLWAMERDVPRLPCVLGTGPPSSPDGSLYPGRQVLWELVVAMLHRQTDQTSVGLGSCKQNIGEIESSIK